MKIRVLALITFISFSLFAQESETNQKATFVGKSEKMVAIPSISTQIATGQFVPAVDLNREVNPKKRGANTAVPGKGLPVGIDPLLVNQQKVSMVSGAEPILVFEATSANATPTDPTGAVGPNHFVNAWNMAFRIYDKEGVPLTEPASLGTLWPGDPAGDPIVFYDQIADRFVITQFTYANGFLVAICQGSDPVNDGWYTYEFLVDAFPDYPKFSLWSDGYYITANKNSGSAGTSEVVYVIERDEIIDGNPDAQIVGFPLTNILTNGFYSPLGFNVNGPNMPPPGNAPIVYMQDDSWTGVDADHLKLWTIDVDWESPENSTISLPEIITTEPFDGLFDGGDFSNLPQPNGPDIDAIQATIMYMAQYRSFSDHNSVVFNFVVDLDGNDDYAGIRWYELRQDEHGNPWAIFQEGTYAQPEGHSAFVGNMCMDVDGNIGLAYTVVSSTVHPSLRYTGRFAADPPGTLTLEEQVIANGNESNPSYRYGDYSQMTIDPNDDKTFWSIGEYFAGSMRKNQVGVFKLAPDFNVDAGPISISAPTDGLLTEADSVRITVRNFGIDSLVNIPVGYRIDNGDIVTETIMDTINSGTNYQFTFATTGDFSTVGQTYQITTWTSYPGDEDNMNDTLIDFVTHLFPNDIGVTQILSPTTGFDLTETESVSVSIKNFGGAEQTGFNVSYVLNDSTPVTEVVADTLLANSSVIYSFAATADLEKIGDYSLVVYTNLPDDSDTSNDTTASMVTHKICQPEIDCTEGDGIARLELSNIDNISGCDPNGYGDYMDMVADVEMGPYNDLTITTNYGDQFVKVWIDFDDNFVFDTTEVVIDDYVIAEGQGGGEYTETMVLDIPYDISLGEHIMRAKTNWQDEVPEDACEATFYGETEDYTLSVSQTTGITNQIKEPNDLVISRTSDNQFRVTLNSVELNETLIITVHNISGQKLIQNRVQKSNGKYEFDFDMSYAKPGMYLVRLGSPEYGKVKKIIVN